MLGIPVEILQIEELSPAIWTTIHSRDTFYISYTQMVVLMSGRAEFKLRKEAGDESVVLETPGSFLLVPWNTWHTAIIEETASVLFITPGEDTQNEVLPPTA